MNDIEHYIGRRVRCSWGTSYYKGQVGVVISSLTAALVWVKWDGVAGRVCHCADELELLDDPKPDNTPLPLPG